MKGKSGQTFVSLVVLLPFLITILSALAASLFLILSRHETLSLCRDSLFEAQTEFTSRLNQLFDLNKPAQRLRIRRRLAENALKAAYALGPEAVAVAQANLAFVHDRQILLRARQEELKTRAIFDPGYVLIRFSNVLRQIPFVRLTETPRAKLHIKMHPPAALTPDHLPSLLFSQRQTLRAQWTIDPQALIPAWLQELLPKTPLLRENCSATVLNMEAKWIPAPGEAKPSMSY